jgi:hypothetical protein
MTAILSVALRHQVHFAPDPKNTSFPTPSVFVETRLVRDIKEFPENAKYVTFQDVIETVVVLPDGEKTTLCSPGINDEHFHVVWNQGDEDFWVIRSRMEDEERLVEIHPDLKNTLLVYASVRANLKLQQAA